MVDYADQRINYRPADRESIPRATATHPLLSRQPTTKQRVLLLLRQRGMMSRADLARATGLSSSTVSSTVAEMAAAGLIIEGGSNLRPAGDGAGRPGKGIALNPRAGAALGIDFGFRHVRVVVADLAHNVLGSAIRRLPEGHTAQAGLLAAVEAVQESLAAGQVHPERLLGAGVGVPGPINRHSGIPGPSHILPGWANVRAAEELSQRLGLPVVVDNDANVAALAELTWGSGQGAWDLVYVKLHSGVGAGVVVNGHIARGAVGGAGEIGHTALDELGPQCRCGNRGCLEVYTSISAVLETVAREVGDDLTLRELLERSAVGDAQIRRILARAGELVGGVMGTVCNVLNPGRVVVGGALAQAGEVLVGPMRDALRRRSVPLVGSATEVVAGGLGTRAGPLGGVALVLREAERSAGPASDTLSLAYHTAQQ